MPLRRGSGSERLGGFLCRCHGWGRRCAGVVALHQFAGVFEQHVDQSVAQLKAQELTISTAVINAGLAVENAYKLYQASVKSREAAEKNADASQVRFDNGMLTNFEVVQNQQTLTASRLSELGRLISYMNAVAEFERVQKVGG